MRIAALVLVVGCADDARDPKLLYESGSRLTAHVFDGGDGAVIFDHWVDTKLDMPCTWATATDGELRCVPATAAAPDFFADAACTIPMVIAPCGKPAFATRYERTCDGRIATAYRVGDAVTTPAFVLGAGGGCSMVPMQPGAYAVTDAIDPSELAKGKRSIAKRDPFEIGYIDGDDGSFAIDQVRADDHLCAFDERIDGAFCAPGEGIATIDPFSTVFGDDGCRDTLANAHIDPSCPEPTPVVAIRGNAACGMANEYFAIGAAAAMTYTQGGTCTMTTPSEGDHYFNIGAALDFSTFPLAVPTPRGTGRLQAKMYSDAHGNVVTAPDHRFVDTMTMKSCTNDTLADGSIRCLPPNTKTIEGDVYYADSACTKIVLVPTATCSAVVAPALFVDGDACGGVTKAYLGNGFFHGAVFKKNAAGACVAGLPIDNYFSVGAEVPLTDFAAVIERG